MRVRLRSANEAEKADVRAWLRLGEEYTVLAIEHLSAGRGTAYRIATRQATPALFEANLFTITDPRVSASWIARYNDTGEIDFVPEPWASTGFWEDYFNGDADTITRYQEALVQMDTESRCEE